MLIRDLGTRREQRRADPLDLPLYLVDLARHAARAVEANDHIQPTFAEVADQPLPAAAPHRAAADLHRAQVEATRIRRRWAKECSGPAPSIGCAEHRLPRWGPRHRPAPSGRSIAFSAPRMRRAALRAFRSARWSAQMPICTSSPSPAPSSPPSTCSKAMMMNSAMCSTSETRPDSEFSSQLVGTGRSLALPPGFSSGLGSVHLPLAMRAEAAAAEVFGPDGELAATVDADNFHGLPCAAIAAPS